MEGYSRKDDEECPQLLDLVAKGAEEKRLELSLSLGPPGGGDWTNSTTQPLSFGYFSPTNDVLKSPCQHHQKTRPSSFLHLQSPAGDQKRSHFLHLQPTAPLLRKGLHQLHLQLQLQLQWWDGLPYVRPAKILIPQNLQKAAQGAFL